MLGEQGDGTLRVEKVEPVRDLGWMNDWSRYPDIVIQCQMAKHEGRWSRPGPWNCTTVYGCTECNYKYMVDSSD